MSRILGVLATGLFFCVTAAVGLGIGARYFAPANGQARKAKSAKVLQIQATDNEREAGNENSGQAEDNGPPRLALAAAPSLMPRIAAAAMGAVPAAPTIASFTITEQGGTATAVPAAAAGPTSFQSDGPAVNVEVKVTVASVAGGDTLQVSIDLPSDGLPSKGNPLTLDLKSQSQPKAPVVGQNSVTFTGLKRTGTYRITATVTNSDGAASDARDLALALKSPPTAPNSVKLSQSTQTTAQSVVYQSPGTNRDIWLVSTDAQSALRFDGAVSGRTYLMGVGKTDDDVSQDLPGSSTSNLKAASDVAQADVNKSVAFASLKPALGKGDNALRVIDVWEQSFKDAAVHIHVPTTDPQELARPVLTGAANGTYADLAAVQSPMGVFGSYLRLQGVNFPANGKLIFPVYQKSSDNLFIFAGLAATVGAPEVDASGRWTVTLTLPTSLQSGAGRMFVIASDGRVHTVSDLLDLNFNAIGTFSAKPLLGNITPAGSSARAVDATTKAYLINNGDFTITADAAQQLPANSQVVLFDVTSGKDKELGRSSTAGVWSVGTKGVAPGRIKIQAAFAQGSDIRIRSDVAEVVINTDGPVVSQVVPPNFGTAPGIQALKITFNPENRITTESAGTLNNYHLRSSGGSGVFNRGTETSPAPSSVDFDPASNTVTLKFAALVPDIYRLEITGRKPLSDSNLTDGIRDIFGNFLRGDGKTSGTDFLYVMQKPDDSVAAAKAPFVTYPEYAARPPVPNGFNPSDHVETRVSRLYYYRDAYRVAQIINRHIQSYNRAGVEVKRQLADKARQAADQATNDRQAGERKAVQDAQDTRAAEHQLEADMADLRQAQQKTQNAASEEDRYEDLLAAARRAQPDPNATGNNPKTETDKQDLINELTRKLERTRQTKQAAETDANALGKRVASDQEAVQKKRAAEAESSEKAQVLTAKEDRAKEDQFRLEVAAAHEDPDSFAAGKPKSEDPVEQVSVSVIGEGLIQLRGPIKGINIVRLMINEIDSPVGQVRIAMHTAQVNGEHGDRMEPVIGRIQRYIDHSRFLTLQSAEMLRRAVVDVASRKAEETGLVGIDDSQHARDEKYLYAFFGRDFCNELRSLDSEFLRSGNKLLSLHSMDTTSLSNALFLLALAKNNTRQEILAQFQALVQCELPQAEWDYFQASGGKKAYGCGSKFQMFSANARFTSLQGHFQNRAQFDDTMTPVQREFIRLAQIFKSRLVVEMELKQRVMERGLIEQRGINDETLRQTAIEKEARARAALENANNARVTSRQQVQSAVSQLIAIASQIAVDTSLTSTFFGDDDFGIYLPYSQADVHDPSDRVTKGEMRLLQTRSDVRSRPYRVELNGHEYKFWISNPQDPRTKHTIVFYDPSRPQDGVAASSTSERWKQDFAEAVKGNLQTQRILNAIRFQNPAHDALVKQESTWIFRLANQIGRDPDQALRFNALLTLVTNDKHQALLKEAMDATIDEFSDKLRELTIELAKPNANIPATFSRFGALHKRILSNVGDATVFDGLVESLTSLKKAFGDLIKAENDLSIAQQVAKGANLPLDHKKFLDMLIDETEDKYIELLEGTRAHTANIDNYIKRVTTSLDDDFNTQFYQPAFREVRNASRMWDVNLGQIESTSILTNNRMFAKVLPQATMEFDLPKRDFLLREAFTSSKAMMDDFGALLNDPTFLSLAKIGSGLPTSSPAAGTGNTSPVRNLLPGLPSQTDEAVMGQPGPGNRQFGSAMEALIPDPAIYKFETGTGYEIRPVIQPDGQAVVFHLFYLYTTNVREPVRADEKHLGRVKRHFIDTDVQLSNFELREVSRYQVALKASRTARGVPFLEDVPGVGVLFRPLPQAESALQENLVYSQATIFPTLFDLMGLRWAPAVADLDSLRLWNDDFIVRGRKRDISNRVYDISSSKVDEFMRIPQGERRTDLYRSQETIPSAHPDGYRGPGLNLRDSELREGFNPNELYPDTRFTPGTDSEGARPQPGPRSGPQLGPRSGLLAPDEFEGPVELVPPRAGARRSLPGLITPAQAEAEAPAGTARLVEPQRLPVRTTGEPAARRPAPPAAVGSARQGQQPRPQSKAPGFLAPFRKTNGG